MSKELNTVEGENYHPDVAMDADLNDHTGNTSNPHAVSKSQVGLSNVENVAQSSHTSDKTNPHEVTAAQTGAVSAGDLTSHTGDTSNPHSVTATQVGALASLETVVTVASANADFTTVKDALASISDNSAIKRYVIKVAPGVYSEDNPLQLKAWVTIEGYSAPTTAINAANASSNLFTAPATPVCGLSNIALGGVTTGYLLDVSTATSMVIRDCTFQESQNAILVANASAIVDLDLIQFRADGVTMVKGVYITSGFVSATNLKIRGSSTITTIIHATGANSLCSVDGLYTNSNNIGTAVHSDSDADVTLFNGRITGDLGDRMGTALRCEGTGSELDVLSTYIQHADYGVYADGDCDVDLSAVQIENCDYGIYTHTTGNETIHIHGGCVENSITWDIYLTESTATLVGSGMKVDEDKLYLDAASVYMAHMSTNTGDEGLGVKGELHVGSPEQGSETVLGEGDSYTRGLIAYSYNGSIYTDISDEVKSYTGSSFTFPDLNVNSAIYISSNLTVSSESDYHRFYGIKMNLTTAQVGGEIVAEYWDGASWTEFNTMTAESGGSYYRKSNQLFKVSTGSYQVRFNPNIETDWTKNNVPSYAGGNRYWVRFRITSTLTTAPIFEQWKIHSNRTEINSDGYVEHMGKSRSYIGISVPWSAFQDAASKIGNQDLYKSNNCFAGLANNEFGADGESIGTVITIPPWVDTSAPLNLSVILVTDYSGDLTMKAWLNSSEDGDTISTSSPGSTVGEVSDTVTKTVVSGQQITFPFNLDISDKGIQSSGSFPEILWINLEAEDLDGEVYGIVFDINFLSWRSGDHV